MLVTGAKGTTATTFEAAFKANVASCPYETANKKVVTDNWPKPPADAAELRFAATLLASVAVLAPFA